MKAPIEKIIIFFSFLPLIFCAQFRQDTNKNVRYLIIPALLRTPETGWGGGASGNITFKTTNRKDSVTRTSSVQVFGIWTERKQNIQGLDATIYFPKEKYILYASSGHSYFPDRFWGVGSLTKDDASERYIFEQFNIWAHFKRRLSKRLFAGIWYEYQNVFRINHDSTGLFETQSFSGKNPYIISAVGLSLSYDSRNAAFWPTKGIFFQSYFLNYDKTTGSDYSFTKWVTDIRYFKKLFSQHVLAVQLYSYTSFGQVPFRNLAALGGQGNLRGFYYGRFRDNNLLTCVAEYRAPLFWRFSACAFAGAGNVYSNIEDLQKYPLRYSFGGGLRFALLENERLNLRVDYGYYNKYNSGFYFTIGESF